MREPNPLRMAGAGQYVTFSDFGVGQRHCTAHRIFTGNHFRLTAAANTRAAGGDNRNVIAFQRLQQRESQQERKILAPVAVW